MKFFLQGYMAKNHISNFTELAKLTGIKLRTLTRRISNPETLLLYEVQSLDNVLHFSNEDILKLVTCDFD